MNVADLFATLRIAPNQKSFDAADKLIDGVKSALVGLAAIAGAHVLAGMIEDTVDLGSHINDLSASTGITTDTLQELGYVAKLNSSDMDSMGAALGKLGNNMKAAAAGGKEQEAAFHKLGVKVTDTHGKLRPVEDVFEDISINQRKMTNETEKGANIFATLGKSGRALIPTMNDIADKGMANIIQEAHELGAVMDGEAIAALDEFGDTQDKVKMALQGLRNQAVIALLPTLQELANSFLEWVKANKEMIKLKLQTVLNILIGALKGVATAANVLLKVFEFLQNHWDIIKVSVLGLAAAMAIFQAKSIAAAIASGAAWLVANIPLVLLAALMTGLILIVDDIITAFQGGDSVLQKFFQERFGVDLVDTLTRVAGGIKAAFIAVVDFLTGKLQALIAFGEKVGKFIYETIHGDTQFQLDEQTSGSKMGALKVRNARALITNGMDQKAAARFANLNDDEMNALTTTVTQAPSGIDRAQIGAAPVTTNTVSAPVTINVDGSKDPAATAAVVKSAIDDHFQQQLVQAAAGVGGVK